MISITFSAKFITKNASHLSRTTFKCVRSFLNSTEDSV